MTGAAFNMNGGGGGGGGGAAAPPIAMLDPPLESCTCSVPVLQRPIPLQVQTRHNLNKSLQIRLV